MVSMHIITNFYKEGRCSSLLSCEKRTIPAYLPTKLGHSPIKNQNKRLPVPVVFNFV